jgi:hypothetical protein
MSLDIPLLFGYYAIKAGLPFPGFPAQQKILLYFTPIMEFTQIVGYTLR